MTRAIEILLVEDNPNEVMLTLRAFRKNAPAHRIHVARDGEEALDYLFSTGVEAERAAHPAPQLILLDLKLPKVTGLEIIKRVKTDPATRRIAVVVLTSSNDERDVRESYDLGVNSYIIKPVDFDQFVEAIRTLEAYWVRINHPAQRY